MTVISEFLSTLNPSQKYRLSHMAREERIISHGWVALVPDQYGSEPRGCLSAAILDDISLRKLWDIHEDADSISLISELTGLKWHLIESVADEWDSWNTKDREALIQRLSSWKS